MLARAESRPSVGRQLIDSVAVQPRPEYRRSDAVVNSVARVSDGRGPPRSALRETSLLPSREDPRPYSNRPERPEDTRSDRLEELCERMERALARQAEFMERSARPPGYADFAPSRSTFPAQLRWAEAGREQRRPGEGGPPQAPRGGPGYPPRPAELGETVLAEVRSAEPTDRPAVGPRGAGPPSTSGVVGSREQPLAEGARQVTFAESRGPSYGSYGYECWTCGQQGHRSFDCPYGRGAEGGAVPKKPSGNWRAGLERQGRP